MPLAQLEGVSMHYEERGEKDCPVVLLAHSLGVDMGMWWPQIDALAERFRFLAYDARGHGGSSVPEGVYSVGEMGRDVLGLLDWIGLERASFCGISMGGSVGQWLGIHAAERLEKLVLVSTAAKIGTTEAWNARIAAVEREGLGPVVAGTMERWFTAEFLEKQTSLVRELEETLRGTSVAGYLGCCAAIRDADFQGDLGWIAAPTLVISGASDPVTPPTDGRFLADGIEGARYLELAGAHLCSVESADRLNAALMEFLSA